MVIEIQDSADRPFQDVKYSDLFTLADDFIFKVLANKEVNAIQIGYRSSAESNMKSALKEAYVRYMRIKELWHAHFNEDFGISTFYEFEDGCLDKLKAKYVHINQLDKKLPFVKGEKLLDLVEFPDFSTILDAFETLGRIRSNEVFRLVPFEKAIEEGFSKITDEYLEKIKGRCQIVLSGRDNIEGVLYTLLYVKSYLKIKKHFREENFRGINQFLIARQIVKVGDGNNTVSVTLPELIEKIEHEAVRAM